MIRMITLETLLKFLLCVFFKKLLLVYKLLAKIHQLHYLTIYTSYIYYILYINALANYLLVISKSWLDTFPNRPAYCLKNSSVCASPIYYYRHIKISLIYINTTRIINISRKNLYPFITYFNSFSQFSAPIYKLLS